MAQKVEASPLEQPRHFREGLTRWALACVVAIALVFYLWGIKKDLPFSPDVDEPTFVEAAAHIAATGRPNPGWFGHPGSTVIYPLSGMYHIWYATTRSASPFLPNPDLEFALRSSPGEFYLLGRLLAVLYAGLTVPLVYRIGRRALGKQVGLIGSLFFALSPLMVEYAQIVRTDSAATFFGMLSLWLCLRLYDRPTTKNQILAGLAIGLAIASRYFMVTVIPILLAVDALILLRTASDRREMTVKLRGAGVGLLGVAVGFALSTPFFFLKFETALRQIQDEAKSTHLGADGLSFTGNLLWYLTSAIPLSITWPLAILAAIGMAVVVWRWRTEQIVLLGFAVTFLLGISASPLHWQRWIIPLLPLFGLFAADGLGVVLGGLSTGFQLGRLTRQTLAVAALVLLSALPLYQVLVFDVSQASPSTRVLAREWILLNLPGGSRIAQEWYTAPLQGKDYELLELKSLAERSALEDYYSDGYRYLVASSNMYGRYLEEPHRYPVEVDFYRALFAGGHLLQEFQPSTTRAGPTIRIYELPDPGSESASRYSWASSAFLGERRSPHE